MGLKKDFSKCNGCHYANYICSEIYTISNRAEKSLFKYSKALAWLDDEEVELEHILALIPYVIWHRSNISDETLSRVRDIEKDSCDEFYSVGEIIDSVKKRWYEHRDYQIDAYLALKDGNYTKVREIIGKINHPFFRSLVREL
jgi:hypothetical protein